MRSSPTPPPPPHPEAYAVYFYVFPSEFPWFPRDWILSQIMPEGGLSCMDPLGSTSLCRGSEVWEMWCMWPRGCTSAVFSDDLTAPAAPVVRSSHIHSCKHTSVSTTAHVQVEDQVLLNACQLQMGFPYCLNDLTSPFTCFSFIGTISLFTQLLNAKITWNITCQLLANKAYLICNWVIFYFSHKGFLSTSGLSRPSVLITST